MPRAHPRADRHHRPQLHHGTPLRLCRGAVSASRAPRSQEPPCPARDPAVRTAGAQSRGRGAPRPPAAPGSGRGPQPPPLGLGLSLLRAILRVRLRPRYSPPAAAARRRLPSSRSAALPAPQRARSWLAPLRPSPNSHSVALPPLSGGHFLLHCYQGTGARKRPPRNGSEGAGASAQAPQPPPGWSRGRGPTRGAWRTARVERPQRRGGAAILKRGKGRGLRPGGMEEGWLSGVFAATAQPAASCCPAGMRRVSGLSSACLRCR